MSGKQASSVHPESPGDHPLLSAAEALRHPRRPRRFGKRALVLLLCLILALSSAGCSKLATIQMLLDGSNTIVVTIPGSSSGTEVVVTPAAPSSSVPDAVKVFFFDSERDEITMTVGETLKLSAQAYPTDSFCNLPVQWSVSDPTVLKLEPEANGRTCNITVLKHQPSGVTLTVSCSGASKDVRVYTRLSTVITTPVPSVPTPAAPMSVKVLYFDRELDEFTQAVGEVLKLSAQVYPAGSVSDPVFWWSVSDPTVMRLEPDDHGRNCTLTVLKHQPGGITLTVTCNGVSKNVKVYTKAGSSPSPSTPAPGTKVTLEGELLYRINIFLSNFSEQGVQSFNVATVSDDYLLHFLEIYCKINHRNQISYIGGEECLSLADANNYMNRFFARSVSPYEGETYLLDAWHNFRYSSGYFRFPAADGESYNYFTIVYDMTNNGDGTYTVQFQNYELNLEEYWNTPGVDYSFYWLNNDQVAQLVWSGRAMPVEGGTAVVRDYVYNGSTTYQILSYEVWGIGFSP